ncbi:unnamed protein product [Discosporangium mesarthrocarpum]
MMMPPILYGTAWKKEKTAELVRLAVKSGFRGIDTACQPKHYDEAGVGEGWSTAAQEVGLNREDLFIQTKFTPLRGQDQQSVPYDPTAPLAEQVRQSVSKSLENLKTTYLDSLILHSPLKTLEETLTVWRGFEEAVAAGQVRGMLGISNCYDLNTLKALCDATPPLTVPVSIVQNRFYKDSGFDTELRKFCRERGIIYQSFWTLTANRHALASPEVVSLAAAVSERMEVGSGGGGGVVTPQQLMFAFVSDALGIVPLSGTTSLEHMHQDLEIMDVVCKGREVGKGRMSSSDAHSEEGKLLSKVEKEEMARILGMPRLG